MMKGNEIWVFILEEFIFLYILYKKCPQVLKQNTWKVKKNKINMTVYNVASIRFVCTCTKGNGQN